MIWDSKMYRRELAVSCFMVGLLGLVGCGDPSGDLRAAVSGTVALDGEPLRQGLVRFVPLAPTTGQKLSIRVEDGRFSAEALHGPVVGRHRIEIESTDTGGLDTDDEDAIANLRQARRRYVSVVKVPPWYNQYSNLTEEVVDGENQYHFELAGSRKR